MVNNRDIDKLIVQKVFEMSQAGNSHTEIGDVLSCDIEVWTKRAKYGSFQ